MKEENEKDLDWSPAPEDIEDMKASGQYHVADGYYNEGSYVNLKWVETLGTVLLIIGALLITGGIISVIQAFDDYSEGYGMIGAALLSSGLVLLFMGALLKVVIQIERNTRL